jgi:hypothetical protein
VARIAWTNNLTGAIPLKAVWVKGEGPGPGKLPYNTPGAPTVIDFAAHPGRLLNLVNTDASQPPGSAVPAANIPHPEVMQFRVESALPR